jgi:alpha-D-xyloside xylohydrolase
MNIRFHNPHLRAARYVILTILIFVSILPAKETFSNYAGRKTDGNSIIVSDTEGKRIRITPYGSAIVRIQSVRPSEEFFADDRYEMVESHQWSGNWTVIEDSLKIMLKAQDSARVIVQIAKFPMRLSFSFEADTLPFLSELDGTWWDADTIRTSLKTDSSEHFTGLGHGYFGREQSLDRKGTIVQRNYGTFHGQQAPLIVPFYLSGKGYGLFLNSTFTNTFNFGVEGRYEISLTGDARMDYFVIAGPHFRSILDRYTQLTGRPRMLPKSALGLALSDKGNDHTSSDPSDERWWKKKIAAHRAAGFPLDHIVNDNRWRAGGGQRCLSRFEWDRTRYPAPDEYQQWVTRNGLIVTLDLNRCIASHSDGWKPSFNIPEPDSIDFNDSAPDLTNDEVREWFWKLFWTKSLDPNLKYPGDALWIDEFDEMGKAPHSMVMKNGRTWREMRNYWFFLVAKSLVQEGWDRSFQGTKRPFVWVRGMTAGGQRYATLWSGDIKPSYDDMRTQVRAMQSAGLSGFPYWGHDAGGFNNWEENRGPDDTMYRQWSMAFGSFSPFWKPHGIGRSRWPLDRPVEVRANALKYSRLRYMLMPYLYTYAHRSFETGIPIARAMVIDHQADPKAWTHDLQYMWGEELLVAPNCSDSTSVSIWLPDGKWFDFWTDTIVTGNREVIHPSPIGTMPIFVKAGSIIPMVPYAPSTAFLRKDSISYHVYTGTDASFELYEDDGISESYRSKDGRRTTVVTYLEANRSLTIAAAVGSYAGAPADRSVRIILHGIPAKVCFAVNGKPLKELNTKRSVQTGQEGMVWDPAAKTAVLILKKRSVTEPLQITPVRECR